MKKAPILIFSILLLLLTGCSFRKPSQTDGTDIADKNIAHEMQEEEIEKPAEPEEENDFTYFNDFDLESSGEFQYDEFTEEPGSLAHDSIPDSDYKPVLCVKEQNLKFIDHVKDFFAYDNDSKLNAAINFLSVNRKGTTQQAIHRSALLYNIVREVFEDEGLPYMIGIGLVSVESAWKPRALSRSRAAGLFQFIRSTAKIYSLRRTSYIEERYHLTKAARASAKYLSNLYTLFGDWKLALAAYNAGEGRIFRAMINAGYTKDWHILESGNFLKRETKEYVSKILAAIIIWENPEAYDLERVEYSENNLQEVEIEKAFSPKGLADSINISLEDFKAFNPHLLNDKWIIPPSDFTVLIPESSASKVAAYFSDETRYKKDKSRYAYQYSWDGDCMVIRIQKGMTLSQIARMYNTNVKVLMHLNDLRSTRIVAGRTLKVPATNYYGEGSSGSEVETSDSPGDFLVVRITRGMTLYELARQYNTSVRELQRINNLKSSRIVAGQLLKVPAPSI